MYIVDKKIDDGKPVVGFTVVLVDAAKTYQETYGFAYTDDSGYFLLNHPGPGEGSSASGAAKDTGAAELFVEVADLKARPPGAPPAGRKNAPAPKQKPRT